jgi:hypothetical protein
VSREKRAPFVKPRAAIRMRINGGVAIQSVLVAVQRASENAETRLARYGRNALSQGTAKKIRG